jgi:hypothetical protein
MPENFLMRESKVKQSWMVLQTVFVLKRQTIVGTWNVRTLFEKGKLKQVEHQMGKHELDILGMSEVRWLGFGEQRMTNGGIFPYSGRIEGEEHKQCRNTIK